jgi:hypothetical protein
MIGHRQLAVGLLDLLLGGGTVNAEDFLVITFLLHGHESICLDVMTG